MSRDGESQAGQARRTFLAKTLAGLGAAAALLSRPRRGRAAQPEAAQPEAAPANGPILYRRSAETERYYRTLYR